MGSKNDVILLGDIEVDETCIGGKPPKSNKLGGDDDRPKPARGRGT